MDTPTVSLIIPVFNSQRFLAAALESAMAQDHPVAEILVVDDGSTDRTAAIARSFEGVQYIHQENQGVSSARNVGIAAAVGGILAFMDSDDTFPPNKIRTQLEHHRLHPEIGFSFTQEVFVYEPGMEPPAWALREEWQEAHICYGAGSMMAYPWVFEKVGGFDPALQVGEMGEWLFRARDIEEKMGLVQEVLLYRRIHDRNLTHRGQEINQQLLQSVRDSLKRRRQRRG